jgi:hypothetical protein
MTTWNLQSLENGSGYTYNQSGLTYNQASYDSKPVKYNSIGILTTWNIINKS